MNENDIVKVAMSWLKTPFFPKMAAVKGVGGDCVTVALAIYQDAGLLPEGIDFPDYSLGQSEHLQESIVEGWLNSSGYFYRLEDNSEFIPGDAIAFRIGPVVHHVGIAISGAQFVHCIRGYGTIESWFQDSTWKKRFAGAWRLVGGHQ